MERPVIILADTDNTYLKALEWKFIETYGNQIELLVITEPSYFAKFFSVERQADTLVVGEGLYDDTIKRHRIQRIIRLTDEECTDSSGMATSQERITTLYKYVSIKTIMNEATYHLKNTEEKSVEKKVRVTCVCSAIGGSGKTTIALAVAKNLTRHHRRVLYLNLEMVQSFSYFLKTAASLPKEACQILRQKSADYYRNLKPYIRTEEFSYLPPLPGSMDALQIPIASILTWIAQAKESGDYDEIVIDADIIWGDAFARILSMSDLVLTIIRQDALSVKKTMFLLNDIDCGKEEKFVFFCNFFDSEQGLSLENAIGKWHVAEYLPILEQNPTLEEMSKADAIENLTYFML
ncbi:MAG: AAA family ATPase [Hespellia sp.]|nr:AAA family ATPase [Hespellia sp.]